MARMITTTQADQEGLVIREPLTIIATTRGPYLDSGDNIIAAPPELGADGSDIKHLMEGMGSLHRMYSLLYTLLVLVLLAGVVSLGLTLYKYYVA